MSDIPRAVLSDHFKARIAGRRIVAGVFMTYQFDPGFFEQEVLPVLMDVALSHSTDVRLLQLEDAIRAFGSQFAVYYDAGALATQTGSSRLDVRRIGIRHGTGVFHPKNVFLLVEEKEADDAGHKRRALLVASLSANLTRAGWWENVEGCHVEEIQEGDKTRLRESLLGFLRRVRAWTLSEEDKAPVAAAIDFLQGTEARERRSSNERLHTHFYYGKESLVDFLKDVAGEWLSGSYLEVISPYFDNGPSCKPLHELCEAFSPKEVRVFLPRDPSGSALCREELYKDVAGIRDCSWGRLPGDLVQPGRNKEAAERFVHAKVYRFFTKSPKREFLFIGSANLTNAAHQLGGNVETGFFVDIEPPAAPDFWLRKDGQRPLRFDPRAEDEPSTTAGRSALSVRYSWDEKRAEVHWSSNRPSPRLSLEAPQGRAFASVEALSTGWTTLPEESATLLAEALTTTSFVHVVGEAKAPLLVLVQEDGMAAKPSLLLSLSATDILRYWSLLTPDLRTAFLEARGADLMVSGLGADLVTKARQMTEDNTLFDRFAGFFHAFSALEKAVREALNSEPGNGNEKEAEYRLFGRKYDSLGTLLDRIFQEGTDHSDVDRYLIALCARQLLHEIRRDFPDFWSRHKERSRELLDSLKRIDTVRSALVARSPHEMAAFLDWFDGAFLRKAAPLERAAC